MNCIKLFHRQWNAMSLPLLLVDVNPPVSETHWWLRKSKRFAYVKRKKYSRGMSFKERKLNEQPL